MEQFIYYAIEKEGDKRLKFSPLGSISNKDEIKRKKQAEGLKKTDVEYIFEEVEFFFSRPPEKVTRENWKRTKQRILEFLKLETDDLRTKGDVDV